jgi:hypothetical protein
MNQQASSFKAAQEKAADHITQLPDETKNATLERFAKFLQGINSTEFIEKEIDHVYAENAYLNDTLKSLQGRDAIKQHFIKTSDAMSAYTVDIDDISSSEKGYYIRWTMKFNAPKLAKGQEIESIGITYAEFDEQGKVILHQDFWDSTSGFFEHVPLLGGGINIIKKRL